MSDSYSIDYYDWVEEFRPISNEQDKNAGVDGFLFLPFGEQGDFVRRFNSEYVWTLTVTDLENDDTLWEISSGFHLVNIQGYLVTTLPHTEDVATIY